MFGIPSFLATSFWTIFTYAFFGIILIGSLYFLYKKYQERCNQANRTAFSNNQQERESRAAEIRDHTISSLQIQHDADSILQSFQQQQIHLEESITAFESQLKTFHTIDIDLEQTNGNLQSKIIDPLATLVADMKRKYLIIQQQLAVLTDAFTQATKTLVAQETQIARVVSQFSEVGLKAQWGIDAIDTTLTRYKQKIKERDATIAKLTDTTEKMREIINEQKIAIQYLQSRDESSPQNSSGKKRHSSRLFKTYPALESLSSNSTFTIGVD